MRSTCRSILVLLLASTPSLAWADSAPSFRREVLPVLTRAGCNSGGCHGTPTGKNGFRLSLRAYDPALDRQTLIRELAGRRIDRLAPDESLLLTKATGRAPHEGGKRIEPDSEAYRILRDWIARGAIDDEATCPVRLSITPEQAFVDAPTMTQSVRVTATFADGSTRDVTNLSRFSLDDERIARMIPSGQVERRLRGEAVVIAEYMGLMATARVAFRDQGAFTWPADAAPKNAIDVAVNARLQELHIPPSPICSDAEFIRRSSLDLTGRLPDPDRVRRFLIDPSPTKRAAWIDELLARDEFADHWGRHWADRLGVNQRFVGKIGAVKYHRWIREQIAANVPDDVLARQILTAQGGNYSHEPAGFWRRLRDPETRAEEVSQLFLGVRIGCAKCHNHPGERWTQDDYYGLAAFFARIQYRNGPFFIQIYDKEETVLPTREGEVVQPRTGKTMPPKFLGAELPTVPTGTDRRQVFADWLTKKENPYFARSSVNRIWFHLFGRGVIDPVDDIRATNPPSIPALLDTLAQEFTSHGYDRKHLIRLITASAAYQRSSQSLPGNADDEKYFSHYPVRRLSAETLLDAMTDAIGVPEKFTNLPLGTPAAAIPDGETKHPLLEAFGRPARAMACECERGTETSLTQALHLVGAMTFEKQIRDPAGRVNRLLSTKTPVPEIVDQLFLASLSRLPTTAERAKMVERITSRPPAEQTQAIEDLLHALITSPEFVFQH